MIVIKNIKAIVGIRNEAERYVAGKEMQKLNTLENAFLIIDGENIADFGQMKAYDASKYENTSSTEIIDASGKFVFPSFCDSHTHIVYAGSREIEYNDKIRGLSYEEIAKKGGGILNSCDLLRSSSEDSLFESAKQRLYEMMSYGTGAMEIKSGYGLSTESELKMLRVIRRLKDLGLADIKANFLPAHAIPREYIGKDEEYIDLIVNEMIPEVGKQALADYIDVFCDKGFFTVDQTDRILNAAAKYGLQPKIHANELAMSGGIQVGVKNGALSVDHLEYVGDAEIESLKSSWENKRGCMPTVLPGAAFFLGMPLSPVRNIMDSGLPLALASDFNPGSAPSGNMQFICSLGCILYKMYPEEVINATTMNTAYAIGLSDRLGSISKGKKANVFISIPMSTYEYLPYSFGNNKVETAIIAGKVLA